jgi:hypothetical protein
MNKTPLQQLEAARMNNADNPPGLAGADTAQTTTGGTKHSADKPPLHLINRAALEAEARVLAFGARKYAEWNWSKGLKWADVARAAIGHLYAFLDGEDLDPESGLPHVAHARTEAGFLLEFIARGTGTDDRRPRAAALPPAPVEDRRTLAVGSREWAWCKLNQGLRLNHCDWPANSWIQIKGWQLVSHLGDIYDPSYSDSRHNSGWTVVRQDDSGTAHPAQTVPTRG